MPPILDGFEEEERGNRRPRSRSVRESDNLSELVQIYEEHTVPVAKIWGAMLYVDGRLKIKYAKKHHPHPAF